ncbi:MAG: ATP-binding cassette domain-containing protein [Peptoniphilaceae bacterium]|nr:ATP-binding cassette domain-containing protein [Peptoniphilaceae bacterium]MDY6019458.1 ATP-binding cassette domain-containing protein [Anaerococcus sp.]
MISIENLSKAYATNQVLKNINFKLDKGEIGLIRGKSGAGKTTLIRCINCLEKFDTGRILIDDIEITPRTERYKVKGKIGMVFQNFNLFNHMTVLENVIAGPTLAYKIDKKKAIAKARSLLFMVGLSDKENFYPYQLSGGQKQRVAIARACALKPEILCFDEPTSALDLDSAKMVVAIINKLSKSGMTIIIISHDSKLSEMIEGIDLKLVDGVIEA